MKKILPIYFFTIIAFLFTNSSRAQGIAINTDGSTADGSALLDVKSTGKGVLVPRMALSDRTLITSPATGLLIYQTDNTPGFYYNAGTPVTPNWTLLGATGPAGSAGAIGPTGPPGAGFANGTGAGQIYLTGSSPFSPQVPQTVTGDVTISSTAVTSYNNIVPSNKGGAGSINGILAANGAGTVSAASTTGSGNVVLATSPTLVTPNLGTIASGNGAALTGLQNIANNTTAGNSIASALGSATPGLTTGSGSVVLATSPTLVTPALGTPSALVGTNISGTAASLTAGKVITDANLTGDVTSVGNTTTYNNVVPVAKGGTGLTSPSLVAGTNITLSGTWPNQTINASGGGTFPSIITAPTAIASFTTSATYQTLKTIAAPSTGYYLVSASINITSQQTGDEYHLKIVQGATTIAGNTDYYNIDGLLSVSTVIYVSNIGISILIQCSNGGNGTGTATGSYSVVKLSN